MFSQSKGEPQNEFNEIFGSKRNDRFLTILFDLVQNDYFGTMRRAFHKFCYDFPSGNISTRREVVEFRWDTQNAQTLPYKEYWEYMGWKGRERQCGNGPHTSVLTGA